MAILVRVLMLAACGPLLAPPGLCVCTAGGPGCVSSHVRPAAAPGNEPEPSHKTACCSHRHGAAEADPNPAPPPQPVPAPTHDHAPGCPAAEAGAARPQWFEPTADTGLVPVLTLFVGPPVPAARECRPPDRPHRHRPGSPPLYLSHCALVI